MLEDMKTLKFTDVLGGVLLTVAALGWIDTLWIFGVEDSAKYTWWNLIVMFAK
jgi:hypothetical protein